MPLSILTNDLARRVRINSWQDAVQYIVIAVLALGIDFLLQKFFPDMSRSIRRLIIVLAVVGLAILTSLIFR